MFCGTSATAKWFDKRGGGGDAWSRSTIARDRTYGIDGDFDSLHFAVVRRIYTVKLRRSRPLSRAVRAVASEGTSEDLDRHRPSSSVLRVNLTLRRTLPTC
jgi:hypothetical protein